MGATRAMDELYLCSCRTRRMYGATSGMEASVFLREIDRDVLRIIGSAPNGFTAQGLPRGTALPANKSKTIPDCGWKRGDRVYNDDYGYGEVREIRDSEEGPVVRVYFENGGEVRFLALHQGRNFTRIGEDR